ALKLARVLRSMVYRIGAERKAWRIHLSEQSVRGGLLSRLHALWALLSRSDVDAAPEARRAIALFSGATLLPVGLLLIGLAVGGWVAGLALGFISLLIWLMDRFAHRAGPYVPDRDEFPAADGLSI